MPGKTKRGRPKRRLMYVVKEDMAEVEVTEEDTEGRNNWRRKSAVVCPDEKSRTKKKKTKRRKPPPLKKLPPTDSNL